MYIYILYTIMRTHKKKQYGGGLGDFFGNFFKICGASACPSKSELNNMQANLRIKLRKKITYIIKGYNRPITHGEQTNIFKTLSNTDIIVRSSKSKGPDMLSKSKGPDMLSKSKGTGKSSKSKGPDMLSKSKGIGKKTIKDHILELKLILLYLMNVRVELGIRNAFSDQMATLLDRITNNNGDTIKTHYNSLIDSNRCDIRLDEMKTLLSELKEQLDSSEIQINSDIDKAEAKIYETLSILGINDYDIDPAEVQKIIKEQQQASIEELPSCPTTKLSRQSHGGSRKRRVKSRKRWLVN
jgi:hypothetical protein